MPTLSYHCLELLLIAYNARNRAILDAQRPNALTPDSIVAVVMAAASTEAFINKFAEHIAIFRENSIDVYSPSVLACSDVIDELEDSKAQVTAKYLIASLTLSGIAFARNKAPFQDFATLIRLRNAIRHAKPASSEDSHPGTKITDGLAQRGIATPLEPGVSFAWFNRLEVPGVARWACESARLMIVGTLDLLPATPPNAINPFEWLNRSFRNHLGFAEPDPISGASTASTSAQG